MSILDIFKKPPKNGGLNYQTATELGTYTARFTKFGTELYDSALVRSCVRPLAEFTSKAHAVSKNKSIERLLNERPNEYMNGREFLAKVRTIYELTNTCFIYIGRDATGKVVSLYPIPYKETETLEYHGKYFIKFRFVNPKVAPMVFPWEDLAVIRKDYNKSDFNGDTNSAIIPGLDLVSTTNQGVANAVKSTANLRGILKNTKTMLSPEDAKKQRDIFVKSYLGLDNEGGIGSLDGTQEFQPINMSPVVANFEQMREFRENIYRYFGVNDDVVMGKMTAEQIESFYEFRVEPFLVDLSNELTSKLFTSKEIAYDNFIVYEANKLQFASLDKKIAVYKEVVLNGGMTPNEWREACNMGPIEGGDKPICRLDVGRVNEEPANTEEGNQDE